MLPAASLRGDVRCVTPLCDIFSWQQPKHGQTLPQRQTVILHASNKGSRKLQPQCQRNAICFWICQVHGAKVIGVSYIGFVRQVPGPKKKVRMFCT